MIFDHANVEIDTDWKLGFVGRNGRGKTTLLRLLMGDYEYRGSIISPCAFEYFPYIIEDTAQTTLEVMKSVIAPFAKWEEQMEAYIANPLEEDAQTYGDALELYQYHEGYVIDEHIKTEIGKLNIKPEVLDRAFETLSPGERTKALLAALFLKKDTFLLIDEPTNHLDVEGRALLADYLNSKKGFILISHDRAFLDTCIDHVLSINKTSIEVIKGNYYTWDEQKELRDQYEQSRNEKLQKEISALQVAKQRTMGWSDALEKTKIGSHSPDRGFIGAQAARTMKRAKSLEHRQDKAIEETKELLKDIETAAGLKMNVLKHNKKVLLRVEDLEIAYPNGNKEAESICNNVNFELAEGECLALEGANGCGKSSIIKAIMGMIEPAAGRITLASGIVISYVSQDTDYLRGSLNDYATQCGVDYTILLTVLRQLDFPRTQFEKEMQYYSEGQRKKVLLARSLATPAHLFVWDEPLNYIDILSRVQIEQVIQEFKPAMLLIEHDKTFVDTVAGKRLQIGER